MNIFFHTNTQFDYYLQDSFSNYITLKTTFLLPSWSLEELEDLEDADIAVAAAFEVQTRDRFRVKTINRLFNGNLKVLS